ncbi:nucleoside-diphosphate-sugar epimerase [Microbacterium testaceum StLB037]|uniref:Nucleoside-diphosphate-sugar epimerase n=1 Tax=Microbacterium testaceum (strain StLB037) TaxID=979556 RepID=E8NF41_MICTS|nr:NAD-dependent epimerase/dehydratase family protein [Microbacterium testaceum]BAJ73895.1 nucleoside-diphosphate-sugar epimerase [Microbacterium testaceum StLB037]
MGSLHGRHVLVTGVTGFVGQILAAQLREHGARVSGVATQATPVEGVDVREHDLRRHPLDIDGVDDVVHLAGLAAVGPSFDDPQLYISANSAMMTNVGEPILNSSQDCRVLVVSSGAVYGAGDVSPLAEDAALSFGSPYAVSKVLVENQAAYYRERGLPMTVARPFNHIGPGQREGFIVPDLAQKLCDLEPGEVLRAGSLDAQRDYTDVRDVAAAYVRLLECDTPRHAVYNVASGVSRSGWDVLDQLVEVLGIPRPEVEIAEVRALDPSVVTGDATRLREETSWVPEIEFETSISDFVASM